MEVTVIVPWRPQEHRIYAYQVVKDWYAKWLPDWQWLPIDTDDEPFNLAACRNAGARLAKSDVIVINDADTLPEYKPLLAACRYVYESNRLALPYDEYRSLRKDGTEQLLNGMQPRKCNAFIVPGATSGVYVATADSWFAIGGQDERFAGWGGEDGAWRAAADTLSHVEIFPGRLYAMHHDSQLKEGPQYVSNMALCYRYTQAMGNKEQMRALIAEWQNV